MNSNLALWLPSELEQQSRLFLLENCRRRNIEFTANAKITKELYINKLMEYFDGVGSDTTVYWLCLKLKIKIKMF